ncbi:hypothetical protein [Stutzerimonas nitrititolerans]|nr:hypothetical protein [Stutzerimonas nitrititolerans]
MEADTTTERLTEPAPPPAEPARSAWERIDEEWAGRDDAPMCM